MKGLMFEEGGGKVERVRVKRGAGTRQRRARMIHNTGSWSVVSQELMIRA